MRQLITAAQVHPCRFVKKIERTRCVHAIAFDFWCGISDWRPLGPTDKVYGPNESITVHDDNQEEVKLELAEAVSEDDYLEPATDGSGRGVRAGSPIGKLGCKALLEGKQGDIVPVKIFDR